MLARDWQNEEKRSDQKEKEDLGRNLRYVSWLRKEKPGTLLTLRRHDRGCATSTYDSDPPHFSNFNRFVSNHKIPRMS